MKLAARITDHSIHMVAPSDGVSFTFEEIEKYVGYPFTIHPMANSKVLICNEGSEELPENWVATELWRRHNEGDKVIEGDVIYCDNDLIK